MNLSTLFRSLDNSEKEELLKMCLKWKGRSETSISYTPLGYWLIEKQTNKEISTRLHNLLQKSNFLYLEEVNYTDFIRLRGAGKGAWDEFKVLYQKHYAHEKNNSSFL